MIMKKLNYFDGQDILYRETGVDGVTDIIPEDGAFIVTREDKSREVIRSNYTTFRDKTDYSRKTADFF
ncbi:hypothetical protein [Holzapfeliella sp. JNUCC 72]